MIRFKQYNKVLGPVFMALTFAACADTWDDHYSDTPLGGAHEGTLWEAITQNAELSNFARVAEACGYDKSLQSSQMFTVFAPTNAHFSAAQADSVIDLYNQEVAASVRLSDNRAIKEFLQNHIARYTYSVAPTTSDSIVMMNGKYEVLTGSTFGNQNLETNNVLYENGVLFTIDHPVTYHPNVFENVRTDSQLDSLAAFLYDAHYFRYELDETNSIPGGIEDGKTVYLDSVMIKENELFYMLGYIDDEDSAYVMLAPTNERWAEMIEEYTPYFNYCDNTDNRDSLTWAMPRLAITRGSVFSLSNNVALAKHLEDGMTAVDSVMSTNAVFYTYRKYYWGNDSLAYYQYDNPYAEGGVFDGAEELICSNGRILKTDKWNVKPQQTFMQEIRIEAESATTIIDEKTTRKRLSRISVPQGSPYYNKISGNQFLEIRPRNERSDNPIISFEVPNVLSNVPYDIFVVTVPAEAALAVGDSLETTPLPTMVHVACLYYHQDGSHLDASELTAGDPRLFSYELEGRGEFPGYYQSSATDVDTICIGSGVVFPTCSYGLSGSQVTLYLGSDVLPEEINDYSRVLLIDCIIFRPRVEATDEQ